MIDVQIETYMYALFVTMALAIATFALTIHSLKKDDFYSETMSLYKAYFVIAFIGWITVGLRDAVYENINLSIPMIVYIGASLILLLAMDEKGRNSVRKMTVGLFATLMITAALALDDEFYKLLVISAFGLIVYAFLFFQARSFSKKFRNSGYTIMGVAFFIVVITSVIQLYSLLVLDDIDLAYSLTIVTSSSGFMLVGIGFLTSIMITEHNQLRSLTLKDPLTGMYNRRGLAYLIDLIIPVNKRYERCLSAITIDIDFFKKINDTYGHDGGDEVLKAFAQLIMECPRASDVSCRLGGEEFVIVLTETDLEGALIIAERIRVMIEDLGVKYQDKVIKLTASFGLATHCSEVDIDKLLKSADKALYKAKEEGRNRVCYVTKDETILTSRYASY